MRKTLFICCLLQGVLLFSPAVNILFAQTNVSGPITQNTTWTLLPNPPNNGSPYIVTGDVTVNPGVTLTIEAGVEVKFNGNYSLIVNGTLNSLGTATQRVKFTSNQSSPAKGDWQGINLGQNNGIQYAIVEYANNGISVSNLPFQQIDNCIIRENNRGIYVTQFTVGVGGQITNNTITNNLDGIEFSIIQVGTVVNNNSIYGNTNYDLKLLTDRNFALDTRNNWWGTTDPNAIMGKILDFLDRGYGATVVFTPFLNAPNGSPMGSEYLYGGIYSNTTLAPLSTPYIAIADVSIFATFTIQAGVEIRFNTNAGLYIDHQATFNVQGTANQPVKFTSNQSTPARGDWDRINISRFSNVQHAIVEYADVGIGIGDFEQIPVVDSCLIRQNNKGIYITGRNATIINNNIIDNTDGIVYERFGGFGGRINNNSILNNTNYNLRALGGDTRTIDAQNNWWGTTDYRLIIAKIFDALEDRYNSPTVIFTPFLDAPNGNPMGYQYLYGGIHTNVTWGIYSPYIAIAHIWTIPNITLTISPGTEIRFTNGAGLEINYLATLIARGTANQMIKLTSNSATPARGDWNTLRLGNNSTVQYAIIEYATDGITIWDVSPQSIDNCIIRHNQQRGIYIFNQLTPIFTSITNTEIWDNTEGIEMSLIRGFGGIINYNSLHNNSNFNIRISSTSGGYVIPALYNWWGTANRAQIDAAIFDKLDNSSLPLVHYDPYKRTPGDNFFLIDNVLMQPSVFNPLNTETLAINYTTEIPSNVTIKIYDFSTWQLVRTLIINQPRPAGPNIDSWDGKNDNSQILPTAIYYPEIEALDPINNRRGGYVPYPIIVGGMVQLMSGLTTPSNFNPYKGEVATISYVLAAPALVTLSVGKLEVRDRLRDLITNKPVMMNNTVIWDGRDSSGNITNPGLHNNFNFIAAVGASGFPLDLISLENRAAVVDYVKSNPYGIYPVQGEVTEIKYRITQPANVTVTVRDPVDNLVRTLVNNQSQGAGEHTLTWDGKDNTGAVVSVPGNYRIRVIAQDSSNLATDTRIGNITVFK